MSRVETHLNELAKAKLAKAKRRREIRYKIIDTVCIYLAVVIGVLIAETALDIEESKSLMIFAYWSPTRFLVAAIVAAGFMFNFEHGGDAVGKKRHLWRRCSHAFGQGAALRSIIEWLYVLFMLAR